MLSKKISLICLTLIQSLSAGVVVLVDLPQDLMQKIVLCAQESAKKAVSTIAEETDMALQFSETPYASHLSLAFIAQEKLKNEEVKHAYGDMLLHLKDIAAKHASIEQPTQNPTATLWIGRFEMPCGDSKKKNYFNLVLALAASDALSALAEDVRSMVKDTLHVEQRFPFNAHITLGRIYEEHDAALAPELQATLQSCLAEMISSELQEMPPLAIKSFMLKGDDEMSDPEFTFELKG